MPIYEYECNACGAQHEFIQKFSESPKRKCPSCGKSRLRKLVSAAAFHLKGSGWYVTDFRDNDKSKSGDAAATSKSSDDSAAAPKAESKANGTADTKADSKSGGAGKSTGKSEPKSASGKSSTASAAAKG